MKHVATCFELYSIERKRKQDDELCSEKGDIRHYMSVLPIEGRLEKRDHQAQWMFCV
ncbi:hypothetical protein AF72_03150 [Xylella taiwanensis]|uniref:Uncharacterized protein n=1 Tax=Xylella taiwanensis TaxID=1444770 RepID=Z9JMC7_9GAMM|nr:hypothetical protein AF72_03150 [Xylella taiwanensis]